MKMKNRILSDQIPACLTVLYADAAGATPKDGRESPRCKTAQARAATAFLTSGILDPACTTSAPEAAMFAEPRRECLEAYDVSPGMTHIKAAICDGWACSGRANSFKSRPGPTWLQAAGITNLTVGAACFNDPDWITHPNCFYRLVMP